MEISIAFESVNGFSKFLCVIDVFYLEGESFFIKIINIGLFSSRKRRFYPFFDTFLKKSMLGCDDGGFFGKQIMKPDNFPG